METVTPPNQLVAIKELLELRQADVKGKVLESDFVGRVPSQNDNFFYWSGFDAALNFVLGRL